MDSMALPTSTVRTPSFESIGPTVDPQALRACSNDIRRLQMSTNLHIVWNFILLHFPTLALNELLEKKCANSVGSVALRSISLNNHPSVDLGPVIFFVFGSVVGVDRVTHVR